MPLLITNLGQEISWFLLLTWNELTQLGANFSGTNSETNSLKKRLSLLSFFQQFEPPQTVSLLPQKLGLLYFRVQVSTILRTKTGRQALTIPWVKTVKYYRFCTNISNFDTLFKQRTFTVGFSNQNPTINSIVYLLNLYTPEIQHIDTQNGHI